MQPEEFWNLCPIEWDEMLELLEADRMATARQSASIVAAIMNYAGRSLPDNKQVTVDELLGIKKGVPVELAFSRLASLANA